MVQLDRNVEQMLENNDIRPKQHPGLSKTKCITLPTVFVKTAIKLIKDYPVKSVLADGEKFNRYLLARHPPVEEKEFYERRRSIYKQLDEDLPSELIESGDEDEHKQRKLFLADKTKRILSQRVYNWQPIVYDEYKVLQYLVRRSPAEYAAIYKIMSELQKRDVKFKPRSFLDFGSGVGTGTWVVSDLWKNSIYEYFLVDSSREMNDLADIMLRGGDENRELRLKNVFFRQFLPSTNSNKYDIVFSGYTLLEMSSAKARAELLLNLWNKCDGYLILVEMGTRAGFNLINEARQFLIEHTRQSGEELDVFSPCPHSLGCPRYSLDDGTPCNFEISCQTLPVNGGDGHTIQELYSYVVLKRGKVGEGADWPRLVRPTLVRSKHTICRMCTKDGKLEEVIFTASKHGK